MATLADLMDIYQPAPPAGFQLANIDLQSTLAKNQAGVNQERVLRNFKQFDLPDLLGAQAARGAFYSSATQNKRNRLATGAGDQITDIQFGLANTQARLASNALLAQTGIQLGSLL